MNEGVAPLELARKVEFLFERQDAREKRRLPNFALSNCTWDDGEVVATFHQLSDLLSETAAIETRSGGNNGGNSAKREIWLGR
jgi:site-specific DNA recombinase